MSDPKQKIVEIGSKVTIKINGKNRVIVIVKEGEGGKDGLVSADTLVAKTVLGKLKGENLSFKSTDGKEMHIEILEVE